MYMIEKISCMLTDVIRFTLASCDYRDCNQICINYLLQVGTHCPHVWNTLFNLCEDIGIQSSPFYLDQ